MAGGAPRRDARVVHRRVGAVGRACVARRAWLRGRDMVRWHAARGPCKARETRVTGHAVSGCCNVVRRLRHRGGAGEAAAVVTGGAAGRDARVAHGRAGTEGGRGLVTGRTIGRGREMRGRLRNLSNARERLAAVAGGAARSDAGVIHLAAPKVVNPALWQVTQSADVAKCPAGFETGATPVKDCPLWQVVQPEVMPAWFIGVLGPYVVPLWQVVHGCEVGIWFAGMPPAAVAKLSVLL